MAAISFNQLQVGFGTRPELLRRVSCHSLVIPGQAVEMLSTRPHDGFMKVRTQTGALWEIPLEFLLLPGQPDPELEVLAPPEEKRPMRTRRVREAEGWSFGVPQVWK